MCFFFVRDKLDHAEPPRQRVEKLRHTVDGLDIRHIEICTCSIKLAIVVQLYRPYEIYKSGI
jgi:hypothetical protein